MTSPYSRGMHTAAARVCGARWPQYAHSGRLGHHAVNISGGLHHSMPECQWLCVYNDVAVAIAWLLQSRASSESAMSMSTSITVTACRTSSTTTRE